MSRGFARTLLLLAVALAVIVGVLWFANRSFQKAVDPDPTTIVSASLQGLREQNRMSAFAARYVAVITSTQSRMGLEAKKTTIIPGTVNYEVDLGRLRDQDVVWNPDTRELRVTLPPMEVSGPQVDLTQIREYDSGGLLMALTNARERLDAANRKAGQAELIRQARAPVPMRLAYVATKHAVENNFALPLRAAGLDAKVVVRFPDETAYIGGERMDRSRSIPEVLNAGTPNR